MNYQLTPVPGEEPGRILLVDDDAANLDVLRATLGGSSYRVFVARSGEEALKVARGAKPLIVLLDVVMPGIDGYETCRRLKDDPETRDAAVIFLSALSDPKDKVQGFEAGAVDFITKPVQPEEVIARVNTHLRIQRLLHRQLEAVPSAAPLGRADDDATGARVVPPRAPGTPVFRTGDMVAFRFRIVRYLAKGGMGELYEAEDLELRERIALKTILSDIAADERAIALFKREVHLARQVTHPNVCRIYDVFRHQSAAAGDRPAGEVVVLAMELLHGETLADKLRRDGRLSPAEILPLVRQMAVGLTAAHRVGVVHRDFKSHNVMLVKATRAEEEMRAVVTDFGLAWRSTQDESTSLSMSLSAENKISGTPAYMAPEQLEGGPVTPATDVYALGVVLYEMVTGALPFVGETPLKMAIKRLHVPPPSPRVHVADLEPRWETTILRCLARRPEERFARAGDVVSALEGERVESGVAPRSAPVDGRCVESGCADAPGHSRFRLCRVRPVQSCTRRHQVDRGLAAENSSNDPEQDYLSDGISEALINRLSQLPGLKVVANSSSSRYKGQNADPQEVARALDVTGILAGRVSQRGDSLSISVELIDGRDRTQMWGEQYLQQGRRPVPGVGGHLSRRGREAARPAGCGPAAQPRGVRDAQPGSVRIAAQRAFPSREGSDGRPAEGGRLLRPGDCRRSGLRARPCRSVRHLPESREQRASRPG